MALAPSAAAAADLDAPDDEESQPEAADVVLPDVEQVDQVPVVEEPVVEESVVEASPTAEPAEEPAAEAAPAAPVAAEPTEEPAAEEPATEGITAEEPIPDPEPATEASPEEPATEASPEEPAAEQPAVEGDAADSGAEGAGDSGAAVLPPVLVEGERSRAAADEIDLPPLEGDYGNGKVHLSVVPDDGVFESRDLTGAAIDLVATDDADVVVDSVTLYSNAGGGVPTYFSPAGTTVTATLTAAPEGFMLPEDVTETLPPCGPSDSWYIYECTQGYVSFAVAADYRRVAVDVSSGVDGSALEGAGFELRAPESAGGAVLATGTSDAAGQVVFAGTVVPGAGYTVVNTSAAADHELAAPVTVDVLAVDTVAEADVPLSVGVVLASVHDAPSVTSVAAEAVSDGSTLFVDVLPLVDGHGADVRLLGVSTSGHGTVSLGTEPGCTGSCPTGLLYRSAMRFSGVETLTFQVASAGGVSTGTVTVTVTAPAPVPSRSDAEDPVVEPDAEDPVVPDVEVEETEAEEPQAAVESDSGALAATGVEPWALAGVAGALVLMGAALLLTGRRPGRTEADLLR